MKCKCCKKKISEEEAYFILDREGKSICCDTCYMYSEEEYHAYLHNFMVEDEEDFDS